MQHYTKVKEGSLNLTLEETRCYEDYVFTDVLYNKSNDLLESIWQKRGFPGRSDSKESACNAGDTGSIPGSGRSPGEGNGNPLQYSCLENSMERGYSPRGSKETEVTEENEQARSHSTNIN